MASGRYTDWPRSRDLLARNSRAIPGGMASTNRCAEPVIAFQRAQGSRVWDIEGNEYIDYHAGFAPYILGHNDPDVNAAITDAMVRYSSNYGSGPTEEEGELAQLMLQCLPMADQVQFFNTGSEATAQAIRVARAATGREHLIRIQGSYNGHHDAVACNVMSTVEQLGGHAVVGDEYPVVPLTAGIPRCQQALLHPVEFNDLAAVETVARRYKVAALITEPVLQNIGVVPPQPGYLESLRDLANTYGFLLIFDEVKTGFRSSIGGYQQICGVQPDLSTFGKALANGYPIAALAGKREYMSLAVSSDVSKRVFIAGTYNSHPLPVAAALACIKKLTDRKLRVYDHLEELSRRLESGLRELFSKHGVCAALSRQGSAHCAYFMDHVPKNWWELANQHDSGFDLRFRRALIERGVYYFPVPAKQGSISFAHTEKDIDVTLEAIDEALLAITKGRDPASEAGAVGARRNPQRVGKT